MMKLPAQETNDGRLVVDVELINHTIYGTVLCNCPQCGVWEELCVWDENGVFHHDPKHGLTIKRLKH